MKKVFYTGKGFIVKGDVLQAFYDTDCFHFPETMNVLRTGTAWITGLKSQSFEV